MALQAAAAIANGRFAAADALGRTHLATLAAYGTHSSCFPLLLCKSACSRMSSSAPAMCVEALGSSLACNLRGSPNPPTPFSPPAQQLPPYPVLPLCACRRAAGIVCAVARQPALLPGAQRCWLFVLGRCKRLAAVCAADAVVVVLPPLAAWRTGSACMPASLCTLRHLPPSDGYDWHMLCSHRHKAPVRWYTSLRSLRQRCMSLCLACASNFCMQKLKHEHDAKIEGMPLGKVSAG